MYARDVLASLRRRWYFLVAGAVATVLLAAAAYSAVPTSYQASTSLLLLPPKSSVTNRGNPFLYLGGLNQALDVLTTRLNSTELQKPIAEAHPKLTIEVARDATTSGPILVVNVSGPDASEALAVMKQLSDQVPVQVDVLQDGLEIPTNSRITSMVLSADPVPEASTKNKLRAGLALAGAGLAGTVVLTGFLDAQLLQRRQRRQDQLANLSRRSGGSAGGGRAQPDPVEVDSGSKARTPVGAARGR